MNFSKVLAFASVVAALFAGSASAQNGILTAAQGTTTALLMDRRTWANRVDSKGHALALYPFFMTVAELSANSDAGYMLLQTLPKSIQYGIVYNFTDSDTPKIKAWLGTLNQVANNIEISLDTTTAGMWTGSSLKVDTSTWSVSGVNLNPYDIKDCNVVQAITCAGAVLTAATSRFSCIEEGIPMLKKCFAPPIGTGCLAYLIRSIGMVTTYCTQNPGTLSSIVCTDRAEGTEAICKYIADMMPSGIPSDTPIVTADADGTMTSIKKNNGGSSATGLAAGATAAAAAVATLLL
jgi:hypothetical protein